jgi:drug/metabolite transporter (DMT)-like permease
LFGLEPVFIALAAIIFNAERLTWRFAAGLVVALAGTAVLLVGSSTGNVKDVAMLGVVLVTLSTMGWAIYTTLIRPVTNKHGALPIACLAIAASGMPTLLFLNRKVVLEIAGLNTTQWLAVGFLSIIGTVLATVAWNYALGKMDNAKAGMFLYVQPLVAAVGGIALLGESLSIWLIGGGVLILAGVALSQMQGRSAMRQFDDNEMEDGLLADR